MFFGAAAAGIRAASRPAMLTSTTASRKNMACHCGWCGAVRQHDGTWEFVDDNDRAEHPVGSAMVTHGICPDCAAAFRADAALGRSSQSHQETFDSRARSSYPMASC